jgi:hypothetical protein
MLPDERRTFSPPFSLKTFGVAKLVVTIQVEHDAHLLLSSKT